jgi:hypothetical protein
MATYLKHKEGQPARKRQPKQSTQPQPSTTVVLSGPDGSQPSPSIQHNIKHLAGLAGIEESLDWIAQGISTLTSGERAVSLSIGRGEDAYPVKVTLAGNDYDDSLDRLTTALERIADSVAKFAGLTRPRLEHWHEQEEYTPRFRGSACDGGAPGPKTDAA